MDENNKKEAENFFEEIEKKKIQEAIDAGFTEAQADYLVKKLGESSLGLGFF